MSYVLHLVAVSVAFLLGAFCLLTAIILYPDQESKIQSKFEDIWALVDDVQKRVLSRHTVFMTQVANLEKRFLDRVFGNKLISGQALGASLCFSLATLSTFYITELCWSPRVVSFLVEPLIRFYIGLLIASVAVGAVAIFYQVRALRRVVVVSAVIFICIWIVEYTPTFNVGPARQNVLEVSVYVLAGFICDVAFIVMTRHLLKIAGEMTQSFKVLAVLVLNLLVALLLVGPWIVLSHIQNRYDLDSWALGFLEAISRSNLFDAVLALLFVFFAALLLIHRLLWPLLTRTLFRMQDIGTKGRRGVLIAVGLALLGWSGVNLPDFVKELVKVLGG
jgi:hypothetical protein